MCPVSEPYKCHLPLTVFFVIVIHVFINLPNFFLLDNCFFFVFSSIVKFSNNHRRRLSVSSLTSLWSNRNSILMRFKINWWYQQLCVINVHLKSKADNDKCFSLEGFWVASQFDVTDLLTLFITCVSVFSILQVLKLDTDVKFHIELNAATIWVLSVFRNRGAVCHIKSMILYRKVLDRNVLFRLLFFKAIDGNLGINCCRFY